MVGVGVGLGLGCAGGAERVTFCWPWQHRARAPAVRVTKQWRRQTERRDHNIEPYIAAIVSGGNPAPAIAPREGAAHVGVVVAAAKILQKVELR